MRRWKGRENCSERKEGKGWEKKGGEKGRDVQVYNNKNKLNQHTKKKEPVSDFDYIK